MMVASRTAVLSRHYLGGSVLILRSAAALALVCLAGCATSLPYYEDDPDFPQGSALYLNEALTVPANSVGAPIRGGRMGSRFQYEPNCRLEVRTLRADFYVVEPDIFEVLGVGRDRDPLTGPLYPTYGGGYSLFGGTHSLFGEESSRVYFNTYIYLQSNLQPDVFRVKCTQLRQAEVGPWYLTGPEIRAVFGDVMTVE